jgi:hypothetical protein
VVGGFGFEYATKKKTIGLNWLLVCVFQIYQKGTVQQCHNLLC